jgi:hypothetical protein
LENTQHVEATQKAVEKYAQNSSRILEELYAKLDISPMSKRSLQRFLKKLATDGNGSENGSIGPPSGRSHQRLKSSEKQQK